jgi:hypothetical protein
LPTVKLICIAYKAATLAMLKQDDHQEWRLMGGVFLGWRGKVINNSGSGIVRPWVSTFLEHSSPLMWPYSCNPTVLHYCCWFEYLGV